MAEASWQDRVDVITWHGYKRYDERTSTMLGNTSELLIGKYNGDLRKLRDEAKRDVKREHQLLQQFSGSDQSEPTFFYERCSLFGMRPTRTPTSE